MYQKGVRLFEAKLSDFGDPAPYMVKTLVIVWIVDGKRKVSGVLEGAEKLIELPDGLQTEATTTTPGMPK